MAEKKGGITVDTEHILPVIKKLLYPVKKIFLREIVSNACDAVTISRRPISLLCYRQLTPDEMNKFRPDSCKLLASN